MANKLGSKILDFLRFDNEEEFDDDFMKMISMNSVKENCSGKHAGKKKSVRKTQSIHLLSVKKMMLILMMKRLHQRHVPVQQLVLREVK